MTKKYEFTVRKREVDATLRHGHDQLTMAEKDYEILKRQLKKKRSITDSAKQVLPTLDGQLKDQETIMRGDLTISTHVYNIYVLYTTLDR